MPKFTVIDSFANIKQVESISLESIDTNIK